MPTFGAKKFLSTGGDFVTETVFSHPSKLDIVRRAKSLGYDVYVFHIGLENSDLAVRRVQHRVEAGGHGVPETKIRERYDRSAPLIREAVRLADRGHVYDNSVPGQLPKLVLTFDRGNLIKIRPNPPQWIRRVYAGDLP